MTGCPTLGCPCLNTRWGPLDASEVDGDDMDVSAVLRRRGEPGAGADLTPHDRFRVFVELDARGWSAQRIAETLGCTARTIVRWRRYRELAEV